MSLDSTFPSLIIRLDELIIITHLLKRYFDFRFVHTLRAFCFQPAYKDVFHVFSSSSLNALFAIIYNCIEPQSLANAIRLLEK